MLCYAAFGFGYILPATFLPALARETIDDAAVFGWAWPVFGVTAAVSAIVASRWIPKAPVLVWAIAQLVMATGVIALLVFDGIGAIVVCAVCVGGTFVVVTLAAIEHARIVVRRRSTATRCRDDGRIRPRTARRAAHAARRRRARCRVVVAERARRNRCSPSVRARCSPSIEHCGSHEPRAKAKSTIFGDVL